MTIERLITNVLDDVRRTDLTAEASAEVCNSIRHYAEKTWWFTEHTASFTTTSSVGAYLLPADFKRIAYAEVQRSSGEWIELYPRHIDEIQYKNQGISHTGYPEYYTIYGQEMRLAYIPDTAYTIRLFYERTYTDLTAQASNVWTLNLEPLIQARASYRVAMSKLHDAELATFYKTMESEELSLAREKHEGRILSGFTKVWS